MTTIRARTAYSRQQVSQLPKSANPALRRPTQRAKTANSVATKRAKLEELYRLGTQGSVAASEQEEEIVERHVSFQCYRPSVKFRHASISLR